MPSKGEVEVGDTRIEFLLDGAGDAVVLIPGGGLDASAFEDLARRIAGAGFRSVAVNPRGAGESTDPAAAERVLRQRWPVVAAAQRAADRATPVPTGSSHQARYHSSSCRA